MFLSEFACPSCGTLLQPANQVRVGRQVQCYACRTTFVVTEQTALPPPQSPASVHVPSPELVHWADEEGEDYGPTPRRLPQQRRLQRKRLRPKDNLQGFWIAIIWGSLALPLIGSWIIVILSSVMYYVWRSEYPKKAKSINRHGWMAWLLGQLIWCPIWIVANKDQFGLVAHKDQPGGVANSVDLQQAQTSSNRARLIGIWESEGSGPHWTMEFSADGRFWKRQVTIRSDVGMRMEAESNGTWEVLSENGDHIKLRIVNSTTGYNFTLVRELIFLDDDTFKELGGTGDIYHRRRTVPNRTNSSKSERARTVRTDPGWSASGNGVMIIAVADWNFGPVVSSSE